MIYKHIITISLIFISLTTLATEEKTWWQERQDDTYYPHDKHEATMQEKGDTCLLCHSFAKTTIRNPKILNKINVIANEALAPICHECHKTNIEAPWDCKVCHPNPTTIWPQNHQFDYTNNHANDGRDEAVCQECHIELSFCTDCHFKRNKSSQVHPLGYRSWHGLEARSSAINCGRCHNGMYCQRCHRGQGR